MARLPSSSRRNVIICKMICDIIKIIYDKIMRRRTKVSRRFLNTSTSAEPGSNNISHCQTYTRVTYVGKFQNPDRRQSSYFKNDNSVSVIDTFKKKEGERLSLWSFRLSGGYFSLMKSLFVNGSPWNRHLRLPSEDFRMRK